MREPVLEELSWISGQWLQREGESETQECWLPPLGGIMLGLHRSVRHDRVFWEYLRIEETTSGLVYWASPMGNPATPFGLKQIQNDSVEFENCAQDFPRLIRYARTKDTLRVLTEGTRSGKLFRLEWVWTLRVGLR